MMIKKQIKKNKESAYHNVRSTLGGFTLVETMFAVMTLTFAVVAMMTIVSSSLFSAKYSRNEITVNYLLQEVIDYIRNDRDTTVFLEGDTWENFLGKYSNCSNPETGCYFDVLSDNTLEVCPSGDCPNLYYDEDAYNTSFYVTDDDINENKKMTNFKRKIVVTQNGSDEINVVVTVNWVNGNLPVSRSLKTSFMKWQQ